MDSSSSPQIGEGSDWQQPKLLQRIPRLHQTDPHRAAQRIAGENHTILSSRRHSIRILACFDPSLQEMWLATRKTELRAVPGYCEQHRCRESDSTALHIARQLLLRLALQMGHSRSEAGNFLSWKAHTLQVLRQKGKCQ